MSEVEAELYRGLDGSNVSTNDVDCGVVGKNCGIRRKDRRKVIDEDGEEGGTNNKALRNTRGREARRRA